MRPIRGLLLCLALLPAVSAAAVWHGPSKPPGGSGGGGVPPKPPDPPTTPPPPTTSAPPTTGTSAGPGYKPNAPAKRPGGASTAGGASGTGPSAPAERGVARTAAVTQPTLLEDDAFALASWEYWWEMHEDALVQLDEGDAPTPTRTSGPGNFTGRGRRVTSAATSAFSEVLPVLLDVLRRETDFELCDSAALAVGRVAPAEQAPILMDDLRRALQHPTLSVRTSATLALGALGSEQALPLLHGLMADTRAGRQAVGESSVPWSLRAYAALSLGLVDEDLAVDPLLDVVLHAEPSERELRSAAATGLGLMRGAGAARAVEPLLTFLADATEDPVVRSHVATALSRLGDASILPALLEVWRDRDAGTYVRQALAIAFGRLARADHAQIVDALEEAIADEADVITRQFAYVALARIGATDDSPRIRDLLRKAVKDPEHKIDRSFAALAAGLLARARPDAETALGDALLQAYEGERQPSLRGALALGLGLSRTSSAAPLLFEDFSDTKDGALRGYLALSLGLLGHEAAADALMSLVTSSALGDGERRRIAMSLALLGRDDVVPGLVAALQRTSSLDEAWSLGQALGQLRSPASVAPLVALIDASQHAPAARAVACVALGLVGEKHSPRFNLRVGEDVNYMARVSVLEEIARL